MPARPEIIESYTQFKPSFRLLALIHSALRSVPTKHLRGIQSILLRDAAGMSHREKRGQSWSRGRKFRAFEVLGRYHPETPDSLPWIEILVDNIWESLAPWERRVPIIRNYAFASTLFHEIGHHIHFTQRPEHREVEDVAERWEKKLSTGFFAHRYWYLLPVVLPPSFLWKLGKDSVRLAGKLRRKIERMLR